MGFCCEHCARLFPYTADAPLVRQQNSPGEARSDVDSALAAAHTAVGKGRHARSGAAEVAGWAREQCLAIGFSLLEPKEPKDMTFRNSAVALGTITLATSTPSMHDKVGAPYYEWLAFLRCGCQDGEGTTKFPVLERTRREDATRSGEVMRNRWHCDDFGRLERIQIQSCSRLPTLARPILTTILGLLGLNRAPLESKQTKQQTDIIWSAMIPMAAVSWCKAEQLLRHPPITHRTGLVAPQSSPDPPCCVVLHELVRT